MGQRGRIGVPAPKVVSLYSGMTKIVHAVLLTNYFHKLKDHWSNVSRRVTSKVPCVAIHIQMVYLHNNVNKPLLVHTAVARIHLCVCDCTP